jgi:hypothetical protein
MVIFIRILGLLGRYLLNRRAPFFVPLSRVVNGRNTYPNTTQRAKCAKIPGLPACAATVTPVGQDAADFQSAPCNWAHPPKSADAIGTQDTILPHLWVIA